MIEMSRHHDGSGASLWIDVPRRVSVEDDSYLGFREVEATPTVVLSAEDMNALVVEWLRGPVGPCGAMGPAGRSGPDLR